MLSFRQARETGEGESIIYSTYINYDLEGASLLCLSLVAGRGARGGAKGLAVVGLVGL